MNLNYLENIIGGRDLADHLTREETEAQREGCQI